MLESFARRTVLTVIMLAAAACGARTDSSSLDDGPECPRPSTPTIAVVPPTIQCVNGSTDVMIELSSSNGQASYQPAGNQCIKIMDASGALVPPYAGMGDVYVTQVYTSPHLSLTPGAAYTLEIVLCNNGIHAYPGAGPFPYTNATLIAPNCGAPDGGTPDSGVPDSGAPDSGAPDSGAPDSGAPDSGVPDSGVPDSGAPDSGAPDSGNKGMTWQKYANDPITGVLQVGCHSGDSLGDCDAYHGDTSCSTPLPVLCKKPLALPEPTTFTVPPDNTHRWSGNVVATTPAVAPATAGLNSRAAVNAYCAAQFGVGWEVAEFHDGWGWNFTAYGNVGTAPRFWVDINDQPDGNCW